MARKKRRKKSKVRRMPPVTRPAGAASAARSLSASRRPVKKRRKRKSSRKQPQTFLQRFLRFAADASVYIFLGAIILAGAVAYVVRDLPPTDNLWRDESGPRVTLLAADGAPLRIHGQNAGRPVRLAELPTHVPQAFLAVEDRNFYHHVGVNPFSVARAVVVNTRSGEVEQGGSTITQQLAKNLFLSAEKTYRRKIQELFLAFWLESKFTKDEILTLYLNRVYFGAGAYGIDAASERYFGKSAHELNLSEAAILAGLVKAPTHYAPDRNPAEAGARGALVIDAMMDAGFISYDAAQGAIAAPVYIEPSRFSGAPYFYDFALASALASVKAPHGEIEDDLVVTTTLDLKMQNALELGFAKGLSLTGLPEGVEAAAVIIDNQGAVRALVGGRDYRRSQFNRASQARRQPGSAFKPFVFLAALEHGVGADAILHDAPIRIGKWAPKNYGDKYYGDVSMTEALARSLNAATLELQEATGRGAVRLTAKRMGFDGELTSGASLGLGVDVTSPLGLAQAYAPFANGGYRVEAHGVRQVSAVTGRKLFQNVGGYADAAASPRSIARVNDMLRAVTVWGTGRNADAQGLHAAGKTGTTQDSRDAWFVGHARGFVCVVWVGRDDNAPMPSFDRQEITGGAAPAVIWREIMTRAVGDRPALTAPLLGPAYPDDAEAMNALPEMAPIGE